MVQTRVTLLAKHHKAKAFSFMGSNLLIAGKSVTLRLGKLNHARSLTIRRNTRSTAIAPYRVGKTGQAGRQADHELLVGAHRPIG